MLFINVILAVVVGAKYKITGGLGTLQDGDCVKTKRLDLWLHLLINALSTLLLGASNYSMQCLCAPTRQDIDKAHSQNLWMDIGVPSVRNIRRVSWPRKILWCLLFMSSVPVHLIYNSVIFPSTSIPQWTWFAVNDDFLTGGPFDITAEPYASQNDTESRLERLQNLTSLVRLENDACIDNYQNPILSEWGDVLLISTNSSTNNSFIVTGLFLPEEPNVKLCDSVAAVNYDECLENGGPNPGQLDLDNREILAVFGKFWKSFTLYGTKGSRALQNAIQYVFHVHRYCLQSRQGDLYVDYRLEARSSSPSHRWRRSRVIS